MSDPDFETCPSASALEEAGYVLADLDARVSEITLVAADFELRYRRSADDSWLLVGTADP